MLRTIKLILVSSLIFTVVPAVFAGPMTYDGIVGAYNSMLIGRTLTNDDGASIKFTSGRAVSDSRYVVNYEVSFPKGAKSFGIEAVQKAPSGVYVDQIAEGVTTTRRNIATIEEPYHVFRIRPVMPQSTDFITRDCIRRSSTEGTICYLKVRYMNDVIVSQFREDYLDR